jgi:haloalkane dehalogenase
MNSPSSEQHTATIRLVKIALLSINSSRRRAEKNGATCQGARTLPYCEGLGRLIACDLIGMGDSDKLENSGPGRYTYAEQCSYLFALWDQLGLGECPGHRLYGSDRHPAYLGRLAGKCATCVPGFPVHLEKNIFVERVLPGAVMRKLGEKEMAIYRKPFARPGEDRRPTLTWPRMIPIEGEPADVVKVVENYAAWLAEAKVPKLFINADPGSILVGRQRELCRAWPNQTELTVKGLHFHDI